MRVSATPRTARTVSAPQSARDDGWVRRLTAIIVLAALSVEGCAAGGSDPGPGAHVRPGEATIVQARRTLVPRHPPAGLALDLVNPAGVGLTDATVHLYATSPPDTPGGALNGPFVLVVYQGGSDVGPYLPGARAGFGGATTATVQGRPATTGTRGDAAWVTWDLESSTSEPPQAGVIGRDVPLAELHRIADAVEGGEREQDLRATTLPSGFEEVASGPVSLAAMTDPGVWPFPSAQLRWRGANGEIVDVGAVAHDDRLAVLLRAAVVDASTTTTIRGRPGAKGPTIVPARDGQTPSMWTWTETGVDVFVTAAGVGDAAIERMIASMRPSSAADWERLRREASNPPPANDNPDDLVVRGTFDGGSWNVTLHQFTAGNGDHFYDAMRTVRFADGRFGGGGGGTVKPDQPLVELQGNDAGVLVDGVVPAAITRVTIATRGGGRFEPTIARRDGWPIAVYGVLVDPRTVVTEIALADSGGTVRYRWTGADTVPSGAGIGWGIPPVP